ncbi:hypothetical protein Q5P01_005406 [Channa striata]|uniref:Uncharacterized protein n=1 Tax=Channa striata TaxID=64152 RepID=A0AA88NG74_CHASR|nr:hypothetical protein Q5P01_005406 [Channa striata]
MFLRWKRAVLLICFMCEVNYKSFSKMTPRFLAVLLEARVIPGGSYDTTGYLKDISFYLQRYPQATTTDKIYLIKITSSREVSNFIERQPRAVRDDYELLCQALEQEYSDPVSQTGLDAAMNVKQGRHECPQVYYCRLLRAYFGSKNEPWMEEDLNFKTLFIKNLHPATSTHLGIAANPRNSTSQHLRELASLGFAKHQEAHPKNPDASTVLTIDTKHLPLTLEGTTCGETNKTERTSLKSNHSRDVREPSRFHRTNQRHDHSKSSWPDKRQNYIGYKRNRPFSASSQNQPTPQHRNDFKVQKGGPDERSQPQRSYPRHHRTPGFSRRDSFTKSNRNSYFDKNAPPECQLDTTGLNRDEIETLKLFAQILRKKKR